MSRPGAVPLLLVNCHGNDTTVGGAEHLVDVLLQELPERGYDVSLLRAFPGPSSGAEETTLYARDWRESPVRRAANHLDDVLSRPTAGLREALERHRPALVHTHNLQGLGTGIWELARRAGIPVVHTLHDYHLLCPRVTLMRRDATPCRPSPLLCGVRRGRLARWSGGVRTVTAVSEHLVRRHAGVFPDVPTTVIRNAVLPEVAGGAAAPGGELRTVGYLGALDRIKGVHLLLEAAPALARLGIRLRLAGDGRLRAEVEAAAAAHENVDYAGRVGGEAKQAFLAAADVGIVPSVWEEPGGPTLTMVEWLAAGRPVLVSPRGGLGEVVEAYPGAQACEPETGAIVAALERLRAPERWREAVAAVAPPLAEGARERWVEAYTAVYASLSGASVGA